MSVLYIALPVALLLGAGGLFACILCIRGGQYDDLDTPPIRILIDDHWTEPLVRPTPNNASQECDDDEPNATIS